MPDEEDSRSLASSIVTGSGVATYAGSSVPATAVTARSLTIDLQGREFTFHIGAADRVLVRQRLRELGRQQKRFAANAGNAANTAQQVGIGIGGALAVSGGVALVTAAAPLALGAALLTGAGALIAVGGMIAGHWLNAKKYAHEEKMERFQDAAEELK